MSTTTSPSDNRLVQILPNWVAAFNKFDFPLPFPILQSLLSRYSRFHSFMYFIPNQVMDAISPRKTRDHVVFMFPDSFCQVGGNTNIERPIFFARQNIYCRLFFHLNHDGLARSPAYRHSGARRSLQVVETAESRIKSGTSTGIQSRPFYIS
jgi:hypothetical protein